MKRKINTLEDIKIDGDIFTACTEALETRDTSILDLLLDNKHPEYEFRKEERDDGSMSPLHKHIWSVQTTIKELTLLQIRSDAADKRMNPEPSCISQTDINIVQTLGAAMNMIKYDPEGFITDFEHWKTYHNALRTLMNHEFGTEPDFD